MTTATKQIIARKVIEGNPSAFQFNDMDKCHASETFVQWVSDRCGSLAFDAWWDGLDGECTDADLAEMVELVFSLAA